MRGRAARAVRRGAVEQASGLSPAEAVLLSRIITAMSDCGMPDELLVLLDRHARASRPIFRMARLWLEEADGDERDETIAHLQEMLDELADEPSEAADVDFDTLERKVLPSVLEHKKRLRELVERHGGVSEVARRAGIPQPSLSRMLNDASRPRRATLYKIARALDVEESDVIGEWVR